ncbi:hypothetical protein [Chelativorans sp. J32]|uniref:hypothetical protein n=1 Tax=Chelativorans sp. J32 TaxID=935840 RepID=UPI0004891AD7|nr:hypothetical protein [Chelativorans sp. J32]
MHCISAIDNCLWSTRTQASVLPLAQLLGARRRDKVMAYTSTLFRSTPEGMAEAAQGYIEKGFRAVKFGWRVFGQDPGRDRELVAAAREMRAAWWRALRSAPASTCSTIPSRGG